MNTDELTQLYETLGLGALKYYLLKVDAKKTYALQSLRIH